MDDDKVKTFQEEFPEIFDGVTGVVEAKLSVREKEQEASIDRLVDTKLRQREFLKSLEAVYPDWRTTWKTEAFQNFLREVEPDSIAGLTNYAFIESDFKNFNSQGAISFFRAFFERQKKRPSSSGDDQSGSSFAQIEKARRELARLRDEKSRGRWAGPAREKEWRERIDALIKIISGQ